MYRNGNVKIEVSGVELAQRAGEIARTKRISFGDALFEARREVRFADTVRQDTGSPLRQQQQSTTPDPAKVREAVDGGLRATPWKANAAGVIDTYSISLGVLEVGSRLAALGLGPQIVSSLKLELSNFLNYTFNPGNSIPGKPSDVIPQATDHMFTIYKQALANKVETQAWSEDGITRPVTGVELRNRADQLSRQRNISFGDALRIARQEITMAADASLTSDQIEQAIAADVKNTLNGVLGDKSQIIFESMDGLKVMEAVKAAIKRLDIGSLGSDALKAAETTVNALYNAKLTPGMVDNFAGKIIAAIQKAYDSAVSSAN